MKHCIVLDKSYLQGVSTQRIQDLCASKSMIMTDALFYELLTAKPAERAQCFAKFPDVENPVSVVGHIGPMLLHEKNTHTKTLDFLSYKINERFKFNRGLCQLDYQLPEEALKHTQEESKRVCDSVETFVRRTLTATSVFPLVTEGSDSSRLKALERYERDIAMPENVLLFYKSVNDSALPPHWLLTEDWATFRMYQISLLFSLHTLHRHRGPVPEPMSNREFTRLEHDVHDSDMMLTAAMAGGLATKEAKLIQWWQLLFPGKELYVS